ncbi:MAG TPA: DISARM system SNF2-like helicase DrmD [Ktedonobacteraceae bacterium]|nr:DISARM system SNF2-like helicase DrmD [Ktedonobacteraceae bacterium]
MLHYQPRLPNQHELVEVRRRRYVVADVALNPLPADVLAAHPFQRQHLVKLSSVEDDALGEELQVIWEIEPGARVIEETQLPQPGRFDPPQRLDTFLHAVRWGAASSADVRALQAPFRSGIELEEYQLDPVARAIQMPRANLLIADDVGLGKTIEAGLVAQELIIRHRARRILIVCPASLQVQWREQMLSKFGLDFHIIDSQAIHELRISRGLQVNPWTHFPRLITSLDFLKRERPMRLFNEVVEGRPVFPRKFDLLILDEAHNVAPAGRGQYAVDSLRTRAIRRLVPHFEHKLFLSATPHNGYPESFAALLELLDNQRFTRRVKPENNQLKTIMVRRLKKELPTRFDGSKRFAEREIKALEVEYTPQERQVHAWLQEYTLGRVNQAQQRGDQTELFAMEFVAMLLKKRLFSSPAAFASTLAKHAQTLGELRRTSRGSRKSEMGILRSRMEKIEEESADDEELDEATEDALAEVAPLFQAATSREQELLERMANWAEQAQVQADSKALRLLEELRTLLKPGGVWSQERVIIFTEYRDTQKWLYELLAREGLAEPGPDGQPRVQMLYGGMSTDDRERIKAAFQTHPADAPVRVLLATDAASEGIDLQNYCSRLIHYEIPWNPNRLEQRNGRVDRHGQQAAQVDICHFVSSKYRQQAGLDRDQLDDDLVFLHQAAEKVNQIREDLGSVGPVIAQQVEEAMLGRRRTPLDTQKAEDRARKDNDSYGLRQAKTQIAERIRQLTEELHESKNELGLTPANVEAVVQTALEFVGQPGLVERTLVDSHGRYRPIQVYEVPDLTGSWEVCTRGLKHPHSGLRRPIVFDHDLARGRDDVVLAHLNHPLVTMSLRLLRAEIWSSGTASHLARVTARVVPSHKLDKPVVVAHARLLILGGDHQRLHEELIAAGGTLGDDQRFERLGEERLKEALQATSAQDPLVPEQLRQSLAAGWPKLEPTVRRALEERKTRRVQSLRKKLDERAAKEQDDIRRILTELKKQIEQELTALSDLRQLTLPGFSPDERHQFDSDRTALAIRAAEIDEEIEREVERIQKRFAKSQARIFPVSVMYIVPERYI